MAVDEGFSYRVPSSLAGRVGVGAIVRVPLAARRVRGYVVALESIAESEADDLKDVRALSSDVPVFTAAMLPTLVWAAEYYVAPLARVLAKTAPPNLPKRPLPPALPGIPPTAGPLSDVAAAAAGGGPSRSVQAVAGTRWTELIRGAITAPLRAGKSVLITAPTVVEVARLAAGLRYDLGARVVEVADQSDAEVTAAWSKAATTGGLAVVGTMRVLWWPVRNLSMVVLVEEGRPGMKERQTPTVVAGRLARVRAAHEGLQLVGLGRVPTIESLHERPEMVRAPGRLWGPVQVVDRTEDPPGQGLLAERVRAAIAGTASRGGRVFLFTHRRGYAPAARCVRCRLLRSCPRCGARPDHRTSCSRCETELGGCSSCGGTRFEPLGAAVGRVTEEARRLVGDRVGDVSTGRQVMVGTEADLVVVPEVDLAVVVDADGLVRGATYRAAEDALGVLARVGATVRGGGRARMMLQTADIRQPVYEALRRADPFAFLKDELAIRKRLSLPPFGEVMVVEVAGTDDGSILDDALEAAIVYGPARAGDRLRWMVQGDDLTGVKRKLRKAAVRLRRQGLRVRVDADPRDF
ncbi:MAG: hypothetical protein OXI84_05835 [bacterium]|nr:hypothetical protein [bacterium]